MKLIIKLKMPTTFKGKSHYPCRIDRIITSINEEGNQIFKAILRETRRPEYGDKFSSRHGIINF